MSSINGPSFHDKLARAQYEDLLKARVLSEAKSAYLDYDFKNHEFDVVISFDKDEDGELNDMIIASLIVYPDARDDTPNIYPSWKPLLESKAHKESDIEGAYQFLIDALRIVMTSHMKHANKQSLQYVQEVDLK